MLAVIPDRAGTISFDIQIAAIVRDIDFLGINVASAAGNPGLDDGIALRQQQDPVRIGVFLAAAECGAPYCVTNVAKCQMHEFSVFLRSVDMTSEVAILSMILAALFRAAFFRA